MPSPWNCECMLVCAVNSITFCYADFLRRTSTLLFMQQEGHLACKSCISSSSNYRLEDHLRNQKQQVVKVILQKAASPPHMDGWIVFVSPHHPSRRRMHSSSRAIIPPKHRRTSAFSAARGDRSAGMSYPPKLPLRTEWSGPHLIHGSLGPPKTTTQMASRLVQPFFVWLMTVTDTQTTLLCL